MREGPTTILWDLLGACNLRCPACGAGARPGINAKGQISDDMFVRILTKLHDEFSCRQLHLYNWTEPLIHPCIVEYCRTAVRRGFHVHISSNLNYLEDPHGLMETGIKTLRISLSGFTQAIYQVGHRGGDVERVKENMCRVSEARERAGARTRVIVYYHKYRHNLDEMAPMAGYAQSLGFEFSADWAFYTPLERLMACLDRREEQADVNAIRQSIVPEVSSSMTIMRPYRGRPCGAIDQLVLNHRGDAMLCCAGYDESLITVGNVLTATWGELQALRYGHKMCGRCMEHGIHVLYTHYYVPELRAMIDRAAEAELAVAPGEDRAAHPADCRCGGAAEGSCATEIH